MKRTDIPPHEDLMHKVRNKYEFILAVSRRARQIVDGAPMAQGVAGVKATTRALGEMLGGHVSYAVKEAEEETR